MYWVLRETVAKPCWEHVIQPSNPTISGQGFGLVTERRFGKPAILVRIFGRDGLYTPALWVCFGGDIALIYKNLIYYLFTANTKLSYPCPSLDVLRCPIGVHEIRWPHVCMRVHKAAGSGCDGSPVVTGQWYINGSMTQCKGHERSKCEGGKCPWGYDNCEWMLHISTCISLYELK
jgi:hypothetical protein